MRILQLVLREIFSIDNSFIVIRRVYFPIAEYHFPTCNEGLLIDYRMISPHECNLTEGNFPMRSLQQDIFDGKSKSISFSKYTLQTDVKLVVAYANQV